MQELKARFAPANGSAARTIVIRLGDPEQGDDSWAIRIEILGFDETFSRRTHGEDWAQCIELAAMLLPVVLQGMVGQAGGGTLDPPFYPREPQPPDLSKLPPEVAALLGGA